MRCRRLHLLHVGDCIGDGKTYLLKPDQLGLHVLERERKRQRQREREGESAREMVYPVFRSFKMPFIHFGVDGCA